MAITTEIIRRLTVIGQTQGLPALQAELAKVADAQSKVAASAMKMEAAQDSATKTSLSAAKQYDALNRSIDPVAKANASLERGQRITTAAFNQGAIGADQLARTTMLLGQRHAETIAVINKGKGVVEASGHAVEGHTEINFKAQMGAMELQHAFRAMFDGMAAGMPISRLLMMEGFRLQQGFSMTGGLGGAVKAVGSQFGWVTGLLTPLKLLIGGTAIGALAAAASFISWENTLTKLQVTLNGLGRATGLTLDGLERIAELGGAAGNLSTASARNLAAGFAGTGQIGPTMIGQLTGASRQFGLATGTNVDEAGATLARAFADPTRGADELNKALGFLDDRTRQTIKSFQDQGDVFSAQKVLFDTLRPRIEGVTDRTWSLSKAWIDVGNSISNATHNLGDFIQKQVDPSLQDKIDFLLKQKGLLQSGMGPATRQFPQSINPGPGQDASPATVARIEATMRTMLLGNSPGTQGAQLATLNAAIVSLTAEAKVAREEAAQLGLEQRQIAASAVAGGIVRSILPDIDARQKLEDQKKLLEGAMLDTAVLRRMGMSADQVNDAFGRVSSQFAFFATGAEKLAQDTAFAVQTINARTQTERTSIEATKSWIDIMRQSGDAATAAATALGTWNKAIAESNRTADDALRRAQDEAAKVFMNPLQKRLYDISSQGRDAAQQITAGPAGAAPAGMGVPQGSYAIRDYVHGAPAVVGYTMVDGRAVMFPNAPGIQAGGVSGAVGGVGGPFGTIPGMAAPGAMQMPAALAGGGVADPFFGHGPNSLLPATAAATTAARIGIQQRTVYDESFWTPLISANKELDAQNKLLDVQQATMGKTTDEIAGAMAAQKMKNQYDAAGLTLTPLQTSMIDAYGRSVAESARRQEVFNESVRRGLDAVDAFRDTTRDVMSTFVGDLRQGKSAMDALSDAADRLTDHLLDAVYNRMTDAIFGQAGKAGGILGGLIQGLGSGQLPAKAGPSYPGTGVIPSFSSPAHTGGLVTRFGIGDNPMRFDLPALYAGAPRYHGGYGLGSDEVRAILKVNESVIDQRNTATMRRQSAQLGRTGAWGLAPAAAGSVEVHVHTDAKTQVEVKKSQAANGQPRIDLWIKKMVAEEVLTPGSATNRGLKTMYGMKMQLTRT